jgi:hypothetical protein
MPEELSPAKAGNRHLGERISKVEDLVKGLIVGNTGMRRAVDVEPQQSIRVNTDTLNSHCNMELLPALGLMDEEVSFIYAVSTLYSNKIAYRRYCFTLATSYANPNYFCLPRKLAYHDPPRRGENRCRPLD